MNKNINAKKRIVRTLQVSDSIAADLEYLKKRRNSPKTWIISKLVQREAELERKKEARKSTWEMATKQ